MTRLDAEPDLDVLADALEGTFPTPHEAPLAITLLRLLAEGAPVSTLALAHRSDRPADEVERRLAAWPNVERDGRGRVVAFSGLTLRPTPSHVHHRQPHALHLVRWDTLFLPEPLERTARVRSTCPATGQPVSLTVTPQSVQDVNPAGAVVSIVVPQSTDDTRSTFCCHVMFLGSPNAGRAWTATRPNSALLSVEQAHELGRRTNERFFAQAQRPTRGVTA